MATFTITVPGADVPRLQAAAAAAGTTPKQAIIDYLKSLVRGYEQVQNDSSFTSSYTPIGGS